MWMGFFWERLEACWIRGVQVVTCLIGLTVWSLQVLRWCGHLKLLVSFLFQIVAERLAWKDQMRRLVEWW